jgi:hypothetical protein
MSDSHEVDEGSFMLENGRWAARPPKLLYQHLARKRSGRELQVHHARGPSGSLRNAPATVGCCAYFFIENPKNAVMVVISLRGLELRHDDGEKRRHGDHFFGYNVWPWNQLRHDDHTTRSIGRLTYRMSGLRIFPVIPARFCVLSRR